MQLFTSGLRDSLIKLSRREKILENYHFRDFLCLLGAIEAQILKPSSMTTGFMHPSNFLISP